MADDVGKDLDDALRADHGAVADPKGDEARQSIRHGEELQKILKKSPTQIQQEDVCPKCKSTEISNRSTQFQILGVCRKCGHLWPKSMSHPNEGPMIPEDPREQALSGLQRFRDPKKNFRPGGGNR